MKPSVRLKQKKSKRAPDVNAAQPRFVIKGQTGTDISGNPPLFPLSPKLNPGSMVTALDEATRQSLGMSSTSDVDAASGVSPPQMTPPSGNDDMDDMEDEGGSPAE